MSLNPGHATSWARTWLLVAAMLGIVFFQGWLAYTVIGDLGQPNWDYRPVPDVYGESPYAMYAPVPYPQHVRGLQGQESLPLKVLTIQGAR